MRKSSCVKDLAANVKCLETNPVVIWKLSPEENLACVVLLPNIMPSKIQENNVEISGNFNMGSWPSEVKTSSRHRTSKSLALSPRASRSLKLRDNSGATLKSEKPVDRSFTGQCSGVVDNIDERHSALLKYSGSCQKQQLVKKAAEVEDVVKYMSNLPRYLQLSEKADNVQEKALNFGVLDWGRLERWKYDQKQFVGRRNKHSTSSSDTSSSFSTFGSSTQSGHSESGSSSVIQTKQSPSLNGYMKSSTKEGRSQELNGKLAIHDADVHGPKSDTKTDVSTGRDQLGLKVEKGKTKEFDSKMVSSNLKCNVISSACVKGNTKTGEGEFERREELLQGSRFHPPDEHLVIAPNVYDFLSVDWSGLPQHTEVAAAHWQERSHESHPRFDSTTFDDERLTEVNRMSFSEDFHVQFADVSPGVPHSCPFPCSSQTTEWSDSNSGSPFDTPSTQTPPDACFSSTDSDTAPIDQCRSKNVEQNEFNSKPVKQSVIVPSDGLSSVEAKAYKEAARDPSPSRLSNTGLNRMNRSFSSKETSTWPMNSASSTDKSGPANSLRDKGNASSRSKSSPLRRLLDPLLKHKGSNRLHSGGPLSVPPSLHADEATSTHGACKSSNAGLNSPTGPLAKRGINFSNCGPADNHGPTQDDQCTPSTMHALLQLACKNGLPLFTFTFNDSDILAATKKKVCISGKGDFEWIYTFYSVHEVKKKSGGWMGQGNKVKRHGYISNVIGQMKVLDSRDPKLTSNDSEVPVMVREFVLFSAELKQAAHGHLDFRPSNELVAIIVEAPREKSGSVDKDEQYDNGGDSSKAGPAKLFNRERSSCYHAEDLQQRHSSIVVILPNGVHGLAAKGEPSPLIDRWRSGGSCDCGGWDVGCTLTVLADQDRRRKSPNSSHVCCSNDSDHVDLFVQGGAQENRHVFSLAAFKEGLYTVDFNASISLIQAFSICIAIIHGGKPESPSEAHSMLDVKISQEPRLIEDDRPKRAPGEVPASYVPYPPLSPVGRV